jgi:hypothetical protein
MVVTAICSDDLRLAYRRETVSGTGQLSDGVSCPENSAVTGGGAVLDGDAGAFVHSSQPADIGDANTTPEDGWAAVTNVDLGPRDLKTYAICKR